MARVLVTSGEERSALASVRSLGKGGHRVIVCSESGRSLAGASRWASLETPVGSPSENPGGFAAAVGDLADRHEVDVVLPVTDPAVLALLTHRERIPREVSVPFPPLDTYRALSDKALVTERAADLGIAVPRQELVSNPEEVDSETVERLGFPAVVKPTRSVVVGRRQTLSSTRVRQVRDREGLRRLLEQLPAEHFPVLVQEFVPGAGAGVFLLRWNGRIYARFAHRRLREKPPSGGVSVYREGVRPPSDLFASSERLLEMFAWRGVAMVEYRVEPDSGTPYLMEINGRLWGSLQLAIDSGVDFPNLLVRLALGEEVRPVTDYRTGVRCRWWWGNVDHVWLRMRERFDRVDDGRATPGEGIGSLLCPWRPGDRFEVLRLSDPRPFMRETRAWFGAAAPGHGRSSS